MFILKIHSFSLGDTTMSRAFQCLTLLLLAASGLSCDDDPPTTGNFHSTGNFHLAATVRVTNVTTSSVTLEASVNPHGESTSAHFEYGTTSEYGSATTATDLDSGDTLVNIRETLKGLQPGTLYHFRFAVSNSKGQMISEDSVFHTLNLIDFGFPLTVGTEWTYKYRHWGYYNPDGEANTISGSQRWQIVSSGSGITPFTVIVHVSRIDTTHYWTLTAHPTDTTFVTQKETTFTISVKSDVVIVRWPVVIIDRPSYDSLYFTQIPREMSEGVDTLACSGTFSPSYVREAWYVRGIGLISWYYHFSGNSSYTESLNLESYSIGNVSSAPCQMSAVMVEGRHKGRQREVT
jgi:hypothetical protein